MSQNSLPVTVKVSEKNEGTDAPWWVLIDPSMLREMMVGVAEHGEIPSADRILSAIAFSLEGPYFSREEAEGYLRSRPYAYSTSAKVWCHSGYRAEQYKTALRAAKAEAKP